MRSRRSAQDDVAEVARRRLELLSAELATIRGAAAPGGPAEDGATSGPSAAGTVGERREEVADGVPPEGQGPTTGRRETSPPGRHALRAVSPPSRLGGWLHDRLPPTLQGRVRLAPGHLTVVALLVAAALALTAWWVVRAEGSSTMVPAATWSEADLPASPSALVTPAVEQAVAVEEDVTEVVVDVAGKVRRPGIVSLPLGSRVVDALEAAGGPRRGVDLTALNLARVLVDGEQIVVGIPPPAGVAAPAAAASGAGTTGGAGLMVNINSATQAELEELPGIGPVTAAAILTWRTDHGAFTAVDELMEVSGIGEATLAEVAPFVTL